MRWNKCKSEVVKGCMNDLRCESALPRHQNTSLTVPNSWTGLPNYSMLATFNQVRPNTSKRSGPSTDRPHLSKNQVIIFHPFPPISLSPRNASRAFWRSVPDSPRSFATCAKKLRFKPLRFSWAPCLFRFKVWSLVFWHRSCSSVNALTVPISWFNCQYSTSSSAAATFHPTYTDRLLATPAPFQSAPVHNPPLRYLWLQKWKKSRSPDPEPRLHNLAFSSRGGSRHPRSALSVRPRQVSQLTAKRDDGSRKPWCSNSGQANCKRNVFPKRRSKSSFGGGLFGSKNDKERKAGLAFFVAILHLAVPVGSLEVAYRRPKIQKRKWTVSVCELVDAQSGFASMLKNANEFIFRRHVLWKATKTEYLNWTLSTRPAQSPCKFTAELKVRNTDMRWYEDIESYH